MKETLKIWFSDYKKFITALAIFYLKDIIKRCWVLVSLQDNILIVQPSVSTDGLNILILKTKNIDAEDMEKIFALFKKNGVETVEADYVRREAGNKRFTIGFRNSDNFIRALELFYLSKKEIKCMVIMQKRGPLLIQPNKATPELNILALEDFNSMVGKEKEKIKAKTSSLEIVRCDLAELTETTMTNF